MVTSDKVYRNDNQGISFTEECALGGKDPYSASKAAAEIIINSMRECFFDPNSVQVQTVRAGNVIGGGDWAKDRLLPDLARSHISQNDVIIRSPDAIRPWQHVLDPLVGYLLLSEDICNNKLTKHEAWNFGPDTDSKIAVRDVIRIFNKSIESNVNIIDIDPNRKLKEHLLLSIDSSKSKKILNWQTKWTSEIAVKRTAEWYKNYFNNQSANNLVEKEIIDYISN